MSAEGALAALAHLYGLETAHTDGLGRRIEVGEEPLVAVLRSLGAPLATAAEAGEALRSRRAELARRRVEPVVVCWEGRGPWIPLRDGAGETVSWTLSLESGERRSGDAAIGALPELPPEPAEDGDDGPARRRLCLGGDLPHGYHRLALEGRGWTAEALVIAAPRRSFAGGGRPAWVPFLPLYALRTARGWGAGDLTDLGRLQAWAAGLGAGAVATLPLLASFLDRPLEPSPYAPLSRRFWNELYLDPTRAPGFAACAEAQRLVASAAFQAERAALQAAPLVDYRGAMALKRRVCEVLARECRARDGEDRRQLERYLARRPEAATYAAFRALVERHGCAWPEWPARLRAGSPEEVVAAALDAAPEESRSVHLWMQWVVDDQVAELARRGDALGTGLYLDFPLGVEAGGYDVWKDRDLFARGVAAGAPPDSLFTRGQDWGLPPLHPEALRARGYDYWIASLRHHLAPAALLRIDHVMQLHRLFWVPKGATAEQGVYVRYPAEELLAVVCLESRRQRTAIAGENLGTVPHEVEEAMALHGLLGLRVLEYELDPDHPPRPLAAGCVAGLNTHDMPTFQGFCAGRDLDELREMGLLEAGEYDRRSAERCHLVGALTAGLAGDKLGEEEKALGKEERDKEEKTLGREGTAAGDAGAVGTEPAGGGEGAVAALLRRQLAWLAASPARWIVVNLEDLWGEEAPQNVPGTGPERPNWRRKAAIPFEAFSSHPEILRALRCIDAERRRAPQPPAGEPEIES